MAYRFDLNPDFPKKDVIALAARNPREMGILTISFLAAEWLARPLSPNIPISFSPAFLEAVLALTVAYLAAEIVFLPESRARWAVVPVLGVAHGLSFSAFPPSYLTAAAITQTLLLTILWLAVSKMPAPWRRPAASVMLVAGIGWFVRMLV